MVLRGGGARARSYAAIMPILSGKKLKNANFGLTTLTGMLHLGCTQPYNHYRTYICRHFASKPCQNARNPGKSVIMPKALPA